MIIGAGLINQSVGTLQVHFNIKCTLSAGSEMHLQCEKNFS